MQTYTVEVKDDGTMFWYQNGKFHRIDGPALEYTDGTKIWLQMANVIAKTDLLKSILTAQKSGTGMANYIV